MYGSEICSDCVEAKKQLNGLQGIELDYRSITATTDTMKEFLAYRDKDEMFATIKADNRIGIPFFLLEDGTKTFDITQYVDVIMQKTPSSCSIDKRNC